MRISKKQFREMYVILDEVNAMDGATIELLKIYESRKIVTKEEARLLKLGYLCWDDLTNMPDLEVCPICGGINKVNPDAWCPGKMSHEQNLYIPKKSIPILGRAQRAQRARDRRKQKGLGKRRP